MRKYLLLLSTALGVFEYWNANALQPLNNASSNAKTRMQSIVGNISTSSRSTENKHGILPVSLDEIHALHWLRTNVEATAGIASV